MHAHIDMQNPFDIVSRFMLSRVYCYCSCCCCSAKSRSPFFSLFKYDLLFTPHLQYRLCTANARLFDDIILHTDCFTPSLPFIIIFSFRAFLFCLKLNFIWLLCSSFIRSLSTLFLHLRVQSVRAVLTVGGFIFHIRYGDLVSSIF